VNAGNWINLAGVLIAGAAAILAVRSACRARKAESAAAEHQRAALEAAQDAAGHAKRSADAEQRIANVAESRQQHQAEENQALDADPWEMAPIPGRDNCNLINRTKTPKYGVTVSGKKIHNSPERFDLIGPGKPVELSVMRFWHPDDSIQVTWHTRQDLADPPQTKREIIPSRL
jgi:hypothetical protein